LKVYTMSEWLATGCGSRRIRVRYIVFFSNFLVLVNLMVYLHAISCKYDLAAFVVCSALWEHATHREMHKRVVNENNTMSQGAKTFSNRPKAISTHAFFLNQSCCSKSVKSVGKSAPANPTASSPPPTSANQNHSEILYFIL
jgi:hypothetical protein